MKRLLLRLAGAWAEWADFGIGWCPRIVRQWEAKQYKNDPDPSVDGYAEHPLGGQW